MFPKFTDHCFFINKFFKKPLCFEIVSVYVAESLGIYGSKITDFVRFGPFPLTLLDTMGV